MNSVEEAIEVAAQAWHERLWNGIVEDAERTLELVERDELWKYFDDPAHAQEALEDARETLSFGRVPWETAEESSKEYARKQVRQTVLDALPAFLYAEADDARMRADMFYTPAIEESHLKWMAREIEETAKEIEHESSN